MEKRQLGYEDLKNCPTIDLISQELARLREKKTTKDTSEIGRYIDLAFDCSVKKPHFSCAYDCLKKLKDSLIEYGNIKRNKKKGAVDARQGRLFEH